MPERPSYRELPVDAPLRAFGVCFWELAAPRRFSHLVFPDGCCALIYRRRPAFAQAGLRVVGPTLRPRKVRLWPGDRFWGLRLAPAACEAVLGLAPAALRDRAVGFHRLDPGRAAALAAALDRQTGFAAAAAAFSTVVQGWGPDYGRVDPAVARAARAIASRGGMERIAAVAARETARGGCGQRQLERRFYRAVGLTLKEFARARRIRAMAAALATSARAGWADFAAAHGFADQAHFAREIALATGQPPGRFEGQVRAFDTALLAAARRPRPH
ncbi:MAG: helix-turn-helix domain-containing protein [Terriglobales bacterium]